MNLEENLLYTQVLFMINFYFSAVKKKLCYKISKKLDISYITNLVFPFLLYTE